MAIRRLLLPPFYLFQDVDSEVSAGATIIVVENWFSEFKDRTESKANLRPEVDVKCFFETKPSFLTGVIPFVVRPLSRLIHYRAYSFSNSERGYEST